MHSFESQDSECSSCIWWPVMMDSGELLVELSGFWKACSAGGLDLLVSGDGRQRQQSQ
jgi:hypothetical protein